MDRPAPRDGGGARHPRDDDGPVFASPGSAGLCNGAGATRARTVHLNEWAAALADQIKRAQAVATLIRARPITGIGWRRWKPVAEKGVATSDTLHRYRNAGHAADRTPTASRSS